MTAERMQELISVLQDIHHEIVNDTYSLAIMGVAGTAVEHLEHAMSRLKAVERHLYTSTSQPRSVKRPSRTQI